MKEECQTYRDVYPLGYKHCSACGCWRPVSDFSVRRWVDWEQTTPRTLSASCRPCEAARARRKTGYQPRVWYPYGSPGSEQYLAHRRHLQREGSRRRRQDPEYRKKQQEYWRIWRNARVGAVARLTINVTDDKNPNTETTRIDAEPFLSWYDRNEVEGVYITQADDRAIRRARVSGVMPLTMVDRIFTQNGCGYLLAVLYDEDVA